ncbi:hypothetical protein AAE478_005175 [Parahypoxylon ruwenzoriense]
MAPKAPESAGLADRMAYYEAVSDFMLPASSSCSIILRLEGQNFARLALRPEFLPDQHIHDAMTSTCSDLLLGLFPGASLAYTRSNRIILVFPSPSSLLGPEGDGVRTLPHERVPVQKLVSRSAGYSSARFNAHISATPSLPRSGSGVVDGDESGTAYFDARVFAVPNSEEVLNYLVWQCRDKSVVHEKEVVPRWAVEGCLVKRELYQRRNLNPKTGQMDTMMRTRVRAEEGGIRQFSTGDLRLVIERYWDDVNSPQPRDGPMAAVRSSGPTVSTNTAPSKPDVPKSPKPKIPLSSKPPAIPTSSKPAILKTIAADNSSISAANQTIFGPNVYVFDPRMPATDIQAKATTIFNQMEANEFGSERYALLFKPGTYNVLFDVGFYTQVAGLGRSPDDVVVDGGANVPAYWMPNRNATCNFWRAFENFSINASAATNNTTTIAVSQAAPLRRMHIRSSNGLWLFQVDPGTGAGGWASGGFMADSVVDGQILPGSQQQWLSRNNKYGSWANAVWNMVFVGDSNAPSQANFPVSPYTTVDRTPVIREKPYLCITNRGQYEVFVPSLQANARGPSWTDAPTPGKAIPIDQFYIAHPSTANVAGMNAALDSGRHIVFTPGIYKLDDTLRVSRAGTIILGLGMSSLVPTSGRPAVSVADVDGVTLAGLIIDASEIRSPSLIEVGPPSSSANHAADPTFLYDLTVRTAGRTINDVGIIINSHNVVGDQLWLWRADHGQGAAWDANPTRNGVVVNGDNVTIYGLFNEHHREYQTFWKGNGGRVYFYQSEIPYDPPNQKSWMSKDGAANGFASYKVADAVTSHEAWGLGIYSYFRDSPTKLENAIEVPKVEGVKLHHLTTVWLNGVPGSEITHIVNGTGGRVYANNPEPAMRQTMSEFTGKSNA